MKSYEIHYSQGFVVDHCIPTSFPWKNWTSRILMDQDCEAVTALLAISRWRVSWIFLDSGAQVIVIHESRGYEYVRMGNVRFTSNLGKGPFIICSKSQHPSSLECSLKGDRMATLCCSCTWCPPSTTQHGCISSVWHEWFNTGVGWSCWIMLNPIGACLTVRPTLQSNHRRLFTEQTCDRDCFHTEKNCNMQDVG